MTIELYYTINCPHARSAMITAQHLVIDVKLVPVSVPNGGTRTPEYLKLNPTHTVPTLVDNGFVLFESRAVVTYLASKYGANTGGVTLYPSDNLQARANVDKIIFFDVTSFHPALKKVAYAFAQKQSPTQEAMDELTDKTNILQTLLGYQKFLTGDIVTVADISVAVSVPLLKIFLPQYYSQKLQNWYQRVVEVVPAVDELNGQAEKVTLERLGQ